MDVWDSVWNPETELYLGELFKAQGANQTGRFSVRGREPQTSPRSVHTAVSLKSWSPAPRGRKDR